MIVYKLGGAALQYCLQDDSVFTGIKSSTSSPMTIVHGGGPEITQTAAQLGLDSVFVDGQRFTDEAMLKVVMMALRGKTNSELVTRLNRAGVAALGASGLDGRLFECTEESPALGLVGRVTKINSAWIRLAMQNGYCPVIASIGYLTTPTLQPCNINADLAATALAQELNAQEFVFTTDAEGVLDANGRCLPRLNPRQLHELIENNVISGGMAVKIRAALEFLAACPLASLRIAGGKTASQIRRVFDDPDFGTRICN